MEANLRPHLDHIPAVELPLPISPPSPSGPPSVPTSPTVETEDLDPNEITDNIPPRPSDPTEPLPTAPPMTSQDPDIHADPGPDNENTPEFVRVWKSRICSTETFTEFEEVCLSFTTAICDEGQRLTAAQNRRPGQPQRAPADRPTNRPVRHNCRRTVYNPIEARRIQTLYCLSKKCAARQILTDSSISYTGTTDNAKAYFDNVYQPKPINSDNLLDALFDHVPTTPTDSSIIDPYTNYQVRQRLSSMANSAPGKDHVEYRHLKASDPECVVMTIIYN